MGRAVSSAALAPCIAVFSYEPEGRSYMAWTCGGVSSKGDGVSVLVRHDYLYGSARAPVAPEAKTFVLIDIKRGAEQHEWIDTTNGVVKGVMAVRTGPLIIGIRMIRILHYARAIDPI